MKYLLVLFLLVGCSTRRTGIVHDYVISEAIKGCSNNGGLHYIVTDQHIDTTIHTKPGTERIVFRCQDGTTIEYSSGVMYHFISEMQLEETLETK